MTGFFVTMWEGVPVPLRNQTSAHGSFTPSLLARAAAHTSTLPPACLAHAHGIALSQSRQCSSKLSEQLDAPQPGTGLSTLDAKKVRYPCHCVHTTISTPPYPHHRVHTTVSPSPWARFHRAFAPCEGVIHTKIGTSAFHRKGGTRFRGRVPYPESVRPLGEASTPLRALPTFPNARPTLRAVPGWHCEIAQCAYTRRRGASFLTRRRLQDVQPRGSQRARPIRA
eukprot:365950-Chlamydomonas_euryale.AAC.2